MVSFAPLNDDTHEDRRRYLDGHLVDVACLDCLAEVKVRKQSEFHTSIQWNADAVTACQEFTRARAEGDTRAHRGCSRLQASIARAVQDGTLQLGGSVD
jgi:hypothetical protein